MLPRDVLDRLTGESGNDTWEPVIHLPTVDANGYPRVCLLSRAELAAGRDDAGDDLIGCVVRARHTVANLRRDGKGLLAVVGGEAAHYVRLRVRDTVEAGDGSERVAVAFAAAGAEADTLGIPLRPMMFRASARVRQADRSDSNPLLLRRLGFG